MKVISSMVSLSNDLPTKSIPGLDLWLQSPLGRRVFTWEQSRLDEAVADVFGFNALQLGLPEYDFLRANRIPLKLKAGFSNGTNVRCALTALPFASQSIDLVVLPHMLEFHPDPHQLLREIERILIPEGQLIIHGFNPVSLWGLRQRLTPRPQTFPWNGHYLSVLRLRDWLSLLGFDLDRGCFGCYIPPFSQESWLRRLRFLEAAGDRWWGIAGGVYLLRAIKRVRGLRLVTPKWQDRAPSLTALKPAAKKEVSE